MTRNYVKGILRTILQKLRLLTTFQKLKSFVMGLLYPPLGTEQKFKMYADLVNSLYPRAAEEIAISKISEKLLLEISSAIKDGRIPEKSLYQTEDRKQDHLLLLVETHDSLVESKQNENQSVLALHNLDSSNPILAQIHKEVRASFATDIGSPFVIVNSRMWITHPNSEKQGPNAFHVDEFLPGHLKCMIYISPLDAEHGFFQIKTDSGVQSINNHPSGTAILFKNSDITHAGIPGTKFPRISIEITLMRATVDYPQAWTGNFYGRHLIEPTIFHHIEEQEGTTCVPIQEWNICKISSGLKVNIGSGKRDWNDWLCFDELDDKGVSKIHFEPSVVFPVADKSVSLFYSSHCFEHLDDATLQKILVEMNRMGASNSLFVLKIPDFDYFLEQYRAGSSTLMNDKGTESVLWTWEGRTEDVVLNRVAMMFCGYWNKAYGDHFSEEIKTSQNAYHGPPIVPLEKLKEIFDTYSPREIAKKLRDFAKSDPEFHRFNHQNAWGRSEMKQFLRENGFRLITTNTQLIVQRFRCEIPDLDDHQAPWSAYYLAEKI